jgi:hypothetical protein
MSEAAGFAGMHVDAHVIVPASSVGDRVCTVRVFGFAVESIIVSCVEWTHV